MNEESKKARANWRTDGIAPSFEKRDGRVYYRMADLLAWEARADNKPAPPAT